MPTGKNDEINLKSKLVLSIVNQMLWDQLGLFLNQDSFFPGRPGLCLCLRLLWYAPRLHLQAPPGMCSYHWGITKPPGHTLPWEAGQWRRVQMWAGASQRGWILALPSSQAKVEPSSQAATPNSQLKKCQPAQLALNSWISKKVAPDENAKVGLKSLTLACWPICGCVPVLQGAWGALGQIRALLLQHAPLCILLST